MVCVLGLGLGACDKEPCSGAGMGKDARELPAAWKALMTVPEGAVACHVADG